MAMAGMDAVLFLTTEDQTLITSMQAVAANVAAERNKRDGGK